MINDTSPSNGHGPEADSASGSTSFVVKTGLAQMLKGGVIMDVVNAEQVNPMPLIFSTKLKNTNSPYR